MWSKESAWRRRRDGVTTGTPAILAGEPYHTAIAALARRLQEAVQDYLDRHPEMDDEARDAAIRAEVVGPAVDEYNHTAEVEEQPCLPENAARDIFSRLRRGSGVLTGLFEDPEITDIHINGPGKAVWVRRNGRHEPLDLPLTKAEIERSIDTWQGGASHTLTPVNWGVDIRQEHARISAVHEHVAVGGPAVSIRLRTSTPVEGAALVAQGMMPPAVWALLETLFVGGRVNTVVGGPMGSGKTTLMQALLRALPPPCRLVTIENPRELELGPQAVQLECHPPQPGDPERRGEITARDLVQRSLRMGAERLVVGECLGAEAWDMLDAMSSGHDGSITTVHGGTPGEILTRVERLCMRASERIPLEAIRGTMKETLALLVVVHNTAQGRQVTAVSELVDLVGSAFVVQDILCWEDGRLCATGYGVSETLKRRLQETGHALPDLSALPRARRKGTGHGPR